MEMCCLATPPKLGLLKLPEVLGRAHLLLLTIDTMCINHTSFPAFILISNSSAKDRLVFFFFFLEEGEGGEEDGSKVHDIYIASYS